MPNQAHSIEERLYLQSEATYGILPADPTGNDVCRFVRMDMRNNPALIPRPDKTGSRGMTAGTPGRKTCGYSLEMGLAASGVAGTPPRCAPVLNAIFGNVADTSGGTCKWVLSDIIKSFSAWSYRFPGTMAQRAAHGLVASNAVWNLGQDAAVWTVDGEGQWILESDQMGVADATQKGGRTTFAPEPIPNYLDGGLTIGFTGSFNVNGTPLGNIQSATLRIVTGNGTRKDTFGTFYPDGTEGAARMASITIEAYDEDSTAMTNLRTAANDKSLVTIICNIGSVAAKIWKLTYRNVQLGPMVLGDGRIRWTSSVGESRASETMPSSRDEVELEIL